MKKKPPKEPTEKRGPGRPKKPNAVTSVFSIGVSAAEKRRLDKLGSAWARKVLIRAAKRQS